VGLLKIGIILERQLKEFLCISEFSCVAVNFADFIGSTRIQRVDFEFLFKFLNGRTSVFGRTSFSRTG